MDDIIPVEEVSDKLFNKVIDMNLNSPLYICRKTVNLMVDKGACDVMLHL